MMPANIRPRRKDPEYKHVLQVVSVAMIFIALGYGYLYPRKGAEQGVVI